MIAAVIFDLYGTLLELPHDSRPFHRLVRRHSHGDVRNLLETALTTDNRTLTDFAARIGLPPQPDLPALEAELQQDLKGIRLFSDVLPTLEKLRRHGLRTAVISNLATPYKQPLDGHHLNRLIDVTVCSCDCGHRKPGIAIYELALAQLDTRPSETIMIGDSVLSDVDGPRKVGMRSLHLLRTADPAKSEETISSLETLPKLLNLR